MVKEILRFFFRRALRLVGGLLVFGSLTLIVFILILDLTVGLENPYLGIVAYMILPAFLILGLLLVPLDGFLRRRRAAAGILEEPIHLVLDLSDKRQRALLYFFIIATVIIIVISTVGIYKGVEFMDTTTFCGLTCHKIMKPEFTAFGKSPHASVPCIECHIGPGAPWFVRAKLSGIPQVYHYTMKDYERPIPTPVAALRPSRDTCENCHWPDRFHGNALWTRITYKQDRANSLRAETMVMKVGSGAEKGANIHSHIVQRIWYLPADAKRTKIAWIKVERVDGGVVEYALPAERDNLKHLRKRVDSRFMDCIDCHNRAAHEFVDYEKQIDLALTKGEIDRSIPFIKKEAMAAVPYRNRLHNEKEQAENLRRINLIPAAYEKKYPEVYRTRAKDIRGAARRIRAICEDSFFPHMRLWSGAYPNWVTHEGCFRCHGALVRVDDKSMSKLSADCRLCHSLPEAAGPPVETLELISARKAAKE